MANFKVSLRLGEKTIVEYVEADSVEDILVFYSQVSEAEVIRIEKVVYEKNVVPQRKYWSLVKVLARSNSGIARQYIFHGVKRSVSERELLNAMRRFLRVEGQRIDSVLTTLWKK